MTSTRYQKISLTAFITLIVTICPPVIANLPVLFQISQVLAQTPADRKAEGDRLLKQGIEQSKTSQYEAALQSWQQALIIYREIKDLLGEGRVLTFQGSVYLVKGDKARAVKCFEQGLAIAKQINDPNLEKFAQQGLQLAQNQNDNRKVQADQLLKQGIEQAKTNQFKAALQSWEQALIIYREIKDRKGESITLNNLSFVYFDLGDYPKTIEYSQQLLTIAKEIKNRTIEAEALGNFGLAYTSLGDYPKAIKNFQQVLAIGKEIKDRKIEGQALGNLSIVYAQLGDYSTAITYSQLLLKVALEIKDRQMVGQTLGNIGVAYRNLQDYSTAIMYLEQSLVVARKIKDRPTEGNALGNLGNTYASLGDYPKALEYHKQSLAIVREIKDSPGEGKTLGNLAVAYLNLGDYPKAIEYSQQDLAIAREIKDRTTEGEALNILGSALYKQGNLTLAESTLMDAMKVKESLRGGLKDNEKVSIFDRQRNTYEILQQVLIAQNKTNAALEIAERGRARAFVELVASRLSPNKNEQFRITPSNIEQIKQIAKLQNATLVQYSIIYDDFKVEGKQQVKQSELYIWIIKPTGEVTFRKADLKPLWQKENTTLADLVISSRDSIGARGRGGGILVNDDPDAPKAKQRLQRLHELLIKPIVDLLPTKESERVIFIPQSSLFLVPFGALQDAQGKYLIEKHTILTTPSIQVLDLTKKQRHNLQNSSKNTLVLGNPTMPSVPPKLGEKPQPLPPLPGAEKEALAIAPLLNTKAITGSQGTKTAIVQKMPSARIIHLATHGLLDDFRGLGSAVALAPDPSPPSPPLSKPGDINGLLTAEEILAMKLQAELVVLSACDTGRGRITGDGVIGLSRSLISAGVPSVMVSLWSVPDAPTAELMTQFYKNFLQRKLDKATALREAMLTTMKTHPNPRDWAAFTLIGESE
jgi:CHAT domain-containing protein